jgi:hypothetical protein
MVSRVLTVLLGLAVSGCGGGGLLGGSATATSPATATTPVGAAATPTTLNGTNLSVYLQTMRDLVEGDPVVQADTFMNAVEAARFEPTTTNRLNYALALATPGHPSSNPMEAQRLLSELLAAQNSLLPEERILALVHLKEVEQRLILDAQAQRLQQEAATATTRGNNQSAQRVAGLIEENRRLQAELDDAQQKLDAITNIERSIRERENGANTQ